MYEFMSNISCSVRRASEYCG